MKTGLHRQRQEDLVGHPPASLLRHAGIPHVRRAHARGRNHRHRGADPGHRAPSCTSCTRSNQGFRLYRRELLMENKWRALRYGIEGQDDRLRQADRSSVPRPDVGVPGQSLMTWWTNSASREELKYIQTILEQGTGADRQLARVPRNRRLQGSGEVHRLRRRRRACSRQQLPATARMTDLHAIRFRPGTYRGRAQRDRHLPAHSAGREGHADHRPGDGGDRRRSGRGTGSPWAVTTTPS